MPYPRKPMVSNKSKTPLFGVILVFLLYGAVFSILSIKRYLAYNCDLDFGNILQAFYGSLDGRFMQMTSFYGDFNVCRWAGHTEIIFAFLLPIFALFRHPYTLLILQTLAIAAGGLAVYALTLRRSGDARLSLTLALAYFLFPYLAAINLSDLHSDPFMILPQLLAWYFLVSGKPKGFWICILIGTLCKEYAAVFNLLLGIMILRQHRSKGAVLIGLALAQYFLLTPLISAFCGTPAYRLGTESHALSLSSAAQNHNLLPVVKDILRYAISPEVLFKGLTLLILLNVALVKFPAGLVLLLPLFVAQLILDQRGLFINHRHTLLIAPFFIVLVEGLTRLRPETRLRHALLFVLVHTLAITFLYPGSLLGRNLSEMFLHPQYRNVYHYKYTAHDRLLDSLLADIPPKAPIAAENNIRTHLANREWAFIHPSPSDISRADYYIFDFFETLDYRPIPEKRGRLNALMLSSGFRQASTVDGIVIIKKDSAQGPLPFFFGKTDDSLPADPRTPISVLSSAVEPAPGGYTLTTRMAKGPGSLQGDALISFFIKGDDTLRVLHLPSYASADLTVLPAGVYLERFFFQVPQGKDLQDRSHLIALYKKDVHLPFFARPRFLISVLYHD
jgi:uncharacterized membrane protein